MRITVTLLQYEHGILRQALDVLDETVRNDAQDRLPDIQELLAFLQEFVDRFHHAKEEQIFFPVVLREFPRLHENLDGILHEHEQARVLFQETDSALQLGDWESLKDSARRLAHHMTTHVTKEEDEIFPIVDNELALHLDEQMNQAFQVFLADFGDDYYQKSEIFANEIQDRLLGPGFLNHGIY
jgi:hemerythrin-like domain-containing protein